MTHQILTPGDAFPNMDVAKLGGGTVSLGTPAEGHDWQMIVIYRGKHCPICTRFLGEINDKLADFNALGIDVIAISADPAEKAQVQIDQVAPDYSVGIDLSIAQMRQLGLYISHPRSAEETDRPFAEPGLLVINADGNLQVVSLANVPFGRPDLTSMLQGLGFIRNPDNNYPIRGTHD